MWNYTLLPTDPQQLPRYGTTAMVSGIIMALLGVVALFFPAYASIVTVAFVAWLMILGGIVAGYLTYKTDRRDWLGWLKTLILIGTALFMLFYPLAGVAALGLLLAIYFLLDAFAGFAMGSLMRPMPKWWLWWLNGLFSLILAIIFLVYWPDVFNEAWLIGIFVGISLLFDGVTLIVIGNLIKKSGL